MTPHQQTRTRNEQQQVRLKQFTIAAATYALAFPLLFLAWLAGLIALPHVFAALGLVVLINVVFFVIFRTGANLNFDDPSLTHGMGK